MSSNPAIELASAIQSASINRSPSPAHDINPSTAASAKIPATLSSPSPPASPSSIPSDVITAHPTPRKRNFPPLPDFRFEQSYLASIKSAQTNYDVAWITIRDQVFFPLVQGIGWNLVLAGWRSWNTGTKFVGEGVGARVRRWWWKVNNWTVPGGDGAKVESVRREGKQVTKGFQDFWVDQFGSAQGD